MDDDGIRSEVLSLLDRFRTQDGHCDAVAFWEMNWPAAEERRRAWAEALDRLGVEAFNGDDPTRARDAFWPLFLLRLAAVKRDPGDRAAIRDFASSADLLGQVLLKTGRTETAEQMLREALTYREGLFRDEPSDAHAAFLYGVALWHWAQLERAKGETSSELDWVRRAGAHLAEVDAAWPGVSFIADELSAVRERLAQLQRNERGDFARPAG